MASTLRRADYERAAKPRSGRAVVEALLEAALGTARATPRDLHIELTLVDRQRALLAAVYSRRPGTLFSIEEVELVIDALEEQAECSVGDLLLGDAGSVFAFSPPPLTVEELRQLIAVVALKLDTSPRDLLLEVSKALVLEQMRLRAALVGWEEPVSRDYIPRARGCSGA